MKHVISFSVLSLRLQTLNHFWFGIKEPVVYWNEKVVYWNEIRKDSRKLTHVARIKINNSRKVSRNVQLTQSYLNFNKLFKH